MAVPIPSANVLQMLRVRIGLDGADTSQDAEIEMVYGLSVQWMENYLDRILYTQSGTEIETFTHVHKHTLSLRGYPTIGITTVVATEGENVLKYHLESSNGLLHFDGLMHAHELVVTYTMDDPMAGPLFLALLAIFDLAWANYNGTVDTDATGAVKAISSDGARVEFDVGSESYGIGGLDLGSGLPARVIGLLNGYRREKC